MNEREQEGTIARLGRSARTAASMVVLALVVGLASGCGSSGGGSSSSTTAAAKSASGLAPIHGTYSPSIDPKNFVRKIDNRYFPLEPGTTFHYKGVHENGRTPQTDDEVVTHQTKKILRVTCTVVRDTVSSRGKPIEKTFDWYAQDKGIDGAQPGIIMPGSPHRGDAYRQEYYPHHALDQARVLGSGGAVEVPYGSYKDTLLTVETSPQIDPGVAERKYYVAGLGDIKEKTVSGNREQIELVSVSR